MDTGLQNQAVSCFVKTLEKTTYTRVRDNIQRLLLVLVNLYLSYENIYIIIYLYHSMFISLSYNAYKTSKPINGIALTALYKSIVLSYIVVCV